MRKQHFDFIIDKCDGFDKKVLRFYPRQSNVHGFNNQPPNAWEDVYKTYMTFSVLHYWENDYVEGEYEKPYELFNYYYDEGEGLRVLREVLSEIVTDESKDEYTITPLGDGIDWEINKDKRNNDCYIFTMINSESGLCYRFRLEQNRITEFYNVLNSFLEHMLEHSVGI